MQENRPSRLLNQFGSEEAPSASGRFLTKYSPHTGEAIAEVTRSDRSDVERAIAAAKQGFKEWSAYTPVRRAEILFDAAYEMKARRQEIAELVALETGKSVKDALGETGAAIQLALFMAGEGQRFFGRTTVSAQPNRYPSVVREPVGICALITAANTPIANVAWKVFPALVCGNAAILKPSEDTPFTAWILSRILTKVGLPNGALTVLHGYGHEVGAALVENPAISLLSFTGSTNVGRQIAKVGGERLAKVCLELGGKNALVVCDDADLDNAVKWALLSSFSNAGQRCAASSRLVVFDAVYDEFRKRLVDKISQLRVGSSDNDDLGPVINQRQLDNMVTALSGAKSRGAKFVSGGARLEDTAHKGGYYLAPTVIEGLSPDDEVSRKELFGPITNLYRVKGFEEAVAWVNDCDYGLTASIHTRNYNRALEFTRRAQVGVATVNGGTHGSEPHMPFGGVKQSGNGGREPGPEALDVYSNVKVIYHVVDPSGV